MPKIILPTITVKNKRWEIDLDSSLGREKHWGHIDWDNGIIRVCRTQSPAEKLSVLMHELQAHLLVLESEDHAGYTELIGMRMLKYAKECGLLQEWLDDN